MVIDLYGVISQLVLSSLEDREVIAFMDIDLERIPDPIHTRIGSPWEALHARSRDLHQFSNVSAGFSGVFDSRTPIHPRALIKSDR